MRVRQAPPLALHHEIETPNGRFYRWGKDEPRPENVPSNHGFDTTAPGGFDTSRVTLPRKPGVDYSDIERLATLRSLGAGGETACETRLKSAPRTSGDEFSIGPESEGWIAHGQDDPTAAEIYRDFDLTQWAPAPNSRAAALGSAYKTSEGSTEVRPGASGAPALGISFSRLANGFPPTGVIEAWYDAQGIDIGSIYYSETDYDQGAGGYATMSGAWSIAVQLSPDNTGLGTDNTGSLVPASPTSGTLSASVPGRKFAYVQLLYAGPLTADGEWRAEFSALPVYGRHGLEKRGSEPQAGFLASDVIANAISRWAPLLNFSTGASGSIRPSSSVIPHLVFKDKTTALAICEGANRYELRNYAVWEDRTFHYHDWGERGRKWRTRVAPSQLSETGPTLERLRNGVIMQWQDVDGSTRFAGPPGSNCDIEDVRLLDTDPENPANQRGIRMWGTPIDMGGVSVESEVIRVGALYLQRLKETDTSGQMQLVGTVEDDRGIVRPAWQVRAGDTIVPVDASDTRERRIIRTSYSEDNFTNTIDLDAPPDGTPDLLAQLGVSVSDLGV